MSKRYTLLTVFEDQVILLPPASSTHRADTVKDTNITG
jgi:hypothetical protein